MMEKKVYELIDSYRDDFTKMLQRWVRIPSVKSEAEDGAPLGREKDFRRYGVAAGVHYLFGNGTKLYAIGSYIDGSGLIEGSVATVSMGMRWDF